jgi:hypothetical protein
VGTRRQYTGDLHDRQRRHRRLHHFQRRHAGCQKHAPSRRHPRALILVLASWLQRQCGLQRAHRTHRYPANARRDCRRTVNRRYETTSRRPQPATAAQEAACRLARSHARHPHRPLAPRPGRQLQILGLLNPRQPIYARQQLRTLRPPARPWRKTQRHHRPPRRRKKTTRRLRRLVARRTAPPRKRKRRRPRREPVQNALLQTIRPAGSSDFPSTSARGPR